MWIFVATSLRGRFVHFRPRENTIERRYCDDDLYGNRLAGKDYGIKTPIYFVNSYAHYDEYR